MQDKKEAEEIKNTLSQDFSDEEVYKCISFYIGDEIFAFDMSFVQEIIWVPNTVNVPLTPIYFLGLANLRGNILPVIDLSILLHSHASIVDDYNRVIVIKYNNDMIGFLVDKVNKVVMIEDSKLEGEDRNITINFVSKVLKEDNSLIQLLDIEKILSKYIFNLTDMKKKTISSDIMDSLYKNNVEESDVEEKQLVSFMLAGQEYAFEIFKLREIIRYPREINIVPNVDSNFLGIINYRNQILPLINLNGLLGLFNNHNEEQSKVLVVNVEDSYGTKLPIGLVVDKIQEILKVNLKDWKIVPELISNKGGDEIKAICELNKRIISVLSLNKICKKSSIELILEYTKREQEKEMKNKDNENNSLNMDDSDSEIQLVTFKLGKEEYGIFIEYIQEIILMPDNINIIPKTPEYIEGMINLRGTVLPVLDMRKRFGLDELENKESQRIIVLHIDQLKIGFIVDKVTEVLCVNKKDIESSPSLSHEQAKIMDKIINLESQKRIILVINPNKLFNEEQLKEMNSLKDNN